MKHVEERVKGRKRPKSSMYDLMTYEHVIIHEFMHCAKFGFKPSARKLRFVEKTRRHFNSF